MSINGRTGLRSEYVRVNGLDDMDSLLDGSRFRYMLNNLSPITTALSFRSFASAGETEEPVNTRRRINIRTLD